MKIAMDIENIQRSNSFSHWGLTYHRSQAAQAHTMKPTQPTMKLALFMIFTFIFHILLYHLSVVFSALSEF